MPEAKPEIQVASCGAATLFKQRYWRTGPGNPYCCLGGMARFFLDQKKPLDAWSSWKALGAGRCAKSHDPCSDCAGWDAAVRGEQGRCFP